MYDGIGVYVENKVSAASPARLIDMLFERARSDLEGAAELMGIEEDARAAADATRRIVHAQQIIAELHGCLDVKNGGKLAQELSRLYEYMQFRLNETVEQRSAEGPREIAELLGDLQEGWQSVLEMEMASAEAASPAPNGARVAAGHLVVA